MPGWLQDAVGRLGMKVGIPVSGHLYGGSRGPIHALQRSGGSESREREGRFRRRRFPNSIFDSMVDGPELTKWVNNYTYDGGKYSREQKAVRFVVWEARINR